MNRFSLSAISPLRDYVEVGGVRYAINPGFRHVLKCLRACADDNLMHRDKAAIVTRTFYQGDAPEDAFGPFSEFVRMKEEEAADGVKDFDFEQDAREIYSAFWKEYGIDLYETELHWYKFNALLSGAFSGENALANKVRLRHVDDSENAKKASLESAKRSVKIRAKHGNVEQNINDEIVRRLQSGLPLDDLMGR